MIQLLVLRDSNASVPEWPVLTYISGLLVSQEMGLNMMTKGTERALKEHTSVFEDVQASYLSGNICTDKKASAVNWIEGRGKSVICEAVIRRDVIENVLKTSPAI